MRAVNARDPESVAALLPWLGAGRSAVLVGSSGAGKSTLTNTLLGEEKMKTAQVRESDSRGRHTTTHRALIALPSGACLIDTPGMRELKPTGEEELSLGGFADIEALAAQCRFRDCAHQGEPGARSARRSRPMRWKKRGCSIPETARRDCRRGDKQATRLAQKADARVLGKAITQYKKLSDKHSGKRR